MTIQLPPPGVWPRNMSRRDPNAELERIERDKLDTIYAIELLLDRLADKHGIRHEAINKAVAGYAENMLGDVFFELEKELAGERDDGPEIC